MLPRMSDIVTMQPGDEGRVAAAAHLFDEPPISAATVKFLASEGHHLLIAYEGEEPAGFVSGVEMTHPDKGTEMFLYELGVDDAFRGRGVAGELLAALKALAEERGCYGMWVITDEDNAAARSAYKKAGGESEENQVVLVWTFGPSL